MEKLRFASCSNTTGSSALESLVQATAPEGRLDVGDFAVDFHPHDLGILETISKTLGGGIGVGEGEVRCEFRSLDVHVPGMQEKVVEFAVDGMQQGIGTLLLCLPCEFEGASSFVSL